ncbi:hypothetical protein [Phenylobacterium sp.]|uniref:hypothetical protein n=1 Tax=Phenylobacterium sp. TaxID=1871053 RepID=UPI00301BB216
MPSETLTRPVTATLARSPSLVVVDPQPPAAPEVRAVLNDVADRLKLGFAMAAAGVKPAEATDADRLFQAMVASRPAAAREKGQARAQSMLAAPAATRANFFGRYGVIDSARYKGLDDAGRTVGKVAVDGARLQGALAKFGDNDAVRIEGAPSLFKARTLKAIDLKALRKLKAIDPDVLAGAKYKKLGLFLNSVHCLEETDEWSASDEIAMGGTATAPDGTTRKIPEFMVSNDFDAGEKKVYGGRGRLLHEWSIFTNSNWPHVYSAVLVMAEKDEGGFGKFLQELWDKVGAEVKKAIAGAVGSAIGAALGSFFGPLGAGLGAAVGWLVGLLVDWILSWFKDDLIAMKVIQLSLGAATKSYYDWAGLTANPARQFSMNFNGDGGRYRVWCSLSVYP